tara:strand:- start:824 stop:1048 length:225 start_codon:yes stop_codon:yes gene_type:complete
MIKIKTDTTEKRENFLAILTTQNTSTRNQVSLIKKIKKKHHLKIKGNLNIEKDQKILDLEDLKENNYLIIYWLY